MRFTPPALDATTPTPADDEAETDPVAELGGYSSHSSAQVPRRPLMSHTSPQAANRIAAGVTRAIRGAVTVASAAASVVADPALPTTSDSVRRYSDENKVVPTPKGSAGSVVTNHSGLRMTATVTEDSDGTGARKPRGIFFHEPRERASPGPIDTEAAEADSRKRGGRTDSRARADLKQSIEKVLVTEEYARAVGRELYKHFEGEPGRLRNLLSTLQERWGFPDRWGYPLLVIQLRRITGKAGDVDYVSEDDWVVAFLRWLKVLQKHCGRTKVTRQRLIQKHHGEDLENAYLIGKKLGEGTFGEVFLAFHKGGLSVQRVIKSMSKAQLSLVDEQVEVEVDTLRSLDHPHIVRIFEAFETEKTLHIAMDYAEGGDLSGAILAAQERDGALPEVWSLAVAEQTASALEYMHSKGVIHCDLKPGNTMLLRPFDLDEAEKGGCEPHVLVADFGLSEIFQDKQGGKQVKGSPSYLAPEGFEGSLSKKSDTWALGVMIYEMLIGQRPFKGTTNLFTLYCQVANTDPPWDGLPPLAKDVVVALMGKDPNERPGAKECLAYEWFERRRAARVEALVPGDVQTLGHANYFHRAVWFCVAAGMGMGDVRELFDLFQAMDVNKSGDLTLQELRDGLQRIGSEQDPDALMALLDLDQDGLLSYTEFIAGALQGGGEFTEQRLQYAFDVFDRDGDGRINMHELRVMLSGDGTVDVLPDGQTVEQVMEEASGGQGEIAFADFRDYVSARRAETPYKDRYTPVVHVSTERKSPTSHDNPEEQASALVDDLLENSMSRLTVSAEKDKILQPGTLEDVDDNESLFPESFEEWMDKYFANSQKDAKLGWLLTFPKRPDETGYIEFYLQRSTCPQVALLAFVLFLYSLWALLAEEFQWAPSIGIWDVPARVAQNLAWIWLCASALVVMIACLAYKMHQFTNPVRFELCLCGWACFVPWVSCFFANRYRVSSLFGERASDIFDEMNSDYDLILVMVGALMFLSMRTHMRFAVTLPIAVSSSLAYILTSMILGTPYTDCGEDRIWAWPATLLVVVSALGLTGHRAVEKQNRVNFLSFQASYYVLKQSSADANVLDPMSPVCAVTAETRSSRLKRALDLTRKLSEHGSRPLRAAMKSLIEVLEGTREDIAQADRLLNFDVGEMLKHEGISGGAQELLLAFFDALPISEPVADIPDEPKGFTGPSAVMSAAVQREPWGWDTLSDNHGWLRPLADAGQLLLSSTAAAAAATPTGVLDSCAARRLAGVFLETLLDIFRDCPRGAEARAALGLHAAHWLAHRLGLWAMLQPWDRVALLVATAGLHCAAGEAAGGCRAEGGGGTLAAGDPLLAHTASTVKVLEALEKSGLAEASDGGKDSRSLRQSVRRLMARARPRCILEDARRVRVRLEQDDQAAWEERTVISGLVLAAADLAFLALPAALHEPWAKLCGTEAKQVVQRRSSACDELSGDILELDVASWLRGLVEPLALPLYETLGRLDATEEHMQAPLQHLRENVKRWKATKLVAVGQPKPPDIPGSGPPPGDAASPPGQDAGSAKTSKTLQETASRDRFAETDMSMSFTMTRAEDSFPNSQAYSILRGDTALSAEGGKTLLLNDGKSAAPMQRTHGQIAELSQSAVATIVAPQPFDGVQTSVATLPPGTELDFSAVATMPPGRELDLSKQEDTCVMTLPPGQEPCFPLPMVPGEDEDYSAVRTLPPGEELPFSQSTIRSNRPPMMTSTLPPSEIMNVLSPSESGQRSPDGLVAAELLSLTERIEEVAAETSSSKPQVKLPGQVSEGSWPDSGA